MRVLIKVGRACNNDCSFCHAIDKRGENLPVADVLHKVDQAANMNAEMVMLSGGEPTVHPSIVTIARYIAKRGLGLGLVTNGRALANHQLLERLLDCGLNYAYVSLHGSTSLIHDAIVRADSFQETLRAIEMLNGRISELYVNTVVTPENIDDLPHIVELLRPFTDLRHKFTMPQPKGGALLAFDQSVPWLSDAAPAVRDAIRLGVQRGLPETRFGHEGFPLCLMKPWTRLLDDLFTQQILFMSDPQDNDLQPTDRSLFTHTPTCSSCELADQCPGMYKTYVQRRGDDEIRKQQLTKPADLLQREAASHEQRAWVRLTYACNNKCRFCLDRGNGTGRHLPAEDIKRAIISQKKQGASRLILSGGEPTTHPDFLAFIRLGRRAGYRWIQVVTNGRMFSYQGLVARSVAAGLNEITFSVHGPTPAIHDALVGVPGAFEQTKAAIAAAVAHPNLVVNIDVVLNAKNIDELPSMLRLFSSWGVSEFDLLHLIPFGAAWLPENRDLFYDPAQHMASIRQALDFARKQQLHIWLNRFPANLAENFEYLIQDPHKLLDEVRGRRKAFETFLNGGPPLPCRATNRCARCYLQPLCSFIEEQRDRVSNQQVSLLEVDLHHPERPARNHPSSTLALIADNSAQVLTYLHQYPDDLRPLRLTVRDIPSLVHHLDDTGSLAGRNVLALVVDTKAQLDAALDAPGLFPIEISINRSTAPTLRSLSPSHHPLVLFQPTYEKLSDQTRHDVPLRPLLASLRFPYAIRHIAPCLADAPLAPTVPVPTRASALLGETRLDAFSLAHQFIQTGFRLYAPRCAACPCRATCPGMHVNWVRAHGLRQLSPKRCNPSHKQ